MKMNSEPTQEGKKAQRYARVRQTMIDKFGSENAWKAHMREIGSRGGKNGDNRPFRDKELAVSAANISAKVRAKK